MQEGATTVQEDATAMQEGTTTMREGTTTMRGGLTPTRSPPYRVPAMNKRHTSMLLLAPAGLSVWTLLSSCGVDNRQQPGSGGDVVGDARQALNAVGAVLTYHNDTARTGQYLYETRLSATNVNAAQFGRLFQIPVEGKVYAQPLYVPGLSMPDGGVHDVIIVATENDNIYAFDATTGAKYWKQSLGTPVPSSDVYPNGCMNIAPTVGITGTPVIDPATNTLYVVAATRPTASTWTQALHALDLATGNDKVAPHNISAQVSGDGPASAGGLIRFDPRRANQRAGLLLSGGRVYVAWGSHCDDGIDAPSVTGIASSKQIFFGWVIAFDAGTLAQTAVFNTTPHADPNNAVEPYGGSIWQSGVGLASDGQNIYLNTGNGPWLPASYDYGDATLKLSPTLSLLDVFSPSNRDHLNEYDLDFAAGGVVLLPTSTSLHPHLLITTGKEGSIYVLDRDHLGGAQPTTGDVVCPAGQAASSCVVSEMLKKVGNQSDPDPYFGVPAYFNGRVYFGGNGDYLKAFAVGGSSVLSGPAAQSPTTFGYPGAIPTVSASSAGDQQAVVWAIARTKPAPYGAPNPAHLRAFRADTLAQIYASNTAGNRTSASDDPGEVPQFTTPTVAGGHVYLPGNAAISVYGLFPSATPAISPVNGTTFGTSTVVTITEATPGASVYYTLDGTDPQAGASGSKYYTGPFTVYSSVTVKARAFLSPTQLSTQPSDVAEARLTGTCTNTFPMCGTNGNACMTCDDRSDQCSSSGYCDCGGSGGPCAVGSICRKTDSFVPGDSCIPVPLSGSWFNPARSGWGLGVSQGSNGSLDVAWYTYTATGVPIWYSGTLPQIPGGYSGNLMSYQWVNNTAVPTVRGTMTLTPTSSTAGKFSWTLDKVPGSEPVQYLAFGGSGSTPPLTGAWYAPSQSGWGEFFDVQGSTVVVDLSLYDSTGQPTWLYGSGAATTSGFTVSLLRVTGINLCPGCTGTPSSSYQSAGTLQVQNINPSNTSATLTTSLSAPLTQWSRTGLPISRLTF